MVTLNITKAEKKMSANDIRNFIYKNYYKRIEFSKEDIYRLLKRLNKKDLLLFGNKLIEKLPDTRDSKHHYESYLKM